MTHPEPQGESGALDITNDMSDAGMEAYCKEERFDDFGITDNQPECIEAAYRAMIEFSPVINIVAALKSDITTLTTQRDDAMKVVRWVHDNFTMLDMSHTEFRVEAAHLAAKLLQESPK